MSDADVKSRPRVFVNKTDPETKPQAAFDHVPQCLSPWCGKVRWCVWQWRWNGKKWDKPPLRLDGSNGDTSRAMDDRGKPTWFGLDACVATAQAKGWGVGLNLKGLPGLVALDLDDCIDESGDIAPWADDLIERCNSYVEVSPSGQGFRILGTVTGLAETHATNLPKPTGHLEIYHDTARYVTVSGLAYGRADAKLADLTDIVVAELANRAKGQRAEQPEPEQPSQEQPSQEQASQGRTDDFSDLALPPDLVKLIAGPAEDRSAAFHHACGWMKDIGLTVEQAIKVFERHPKGIAGKYEGRLAQEVARCWPKLKKKTSGADGWTADEDDEWGSHTAEERTSVFFKASELAGKPVPPREFLVEGLIPMGTVTLLGGDGGTGKSLLALQLAVSAALNKPWIGKPVRPGPVVFLSAEDDQAELHRRLADVAAAIGADICELGFLTMRSLVGEDALLAKLRKDGTLQDTDLLLEVERRLEEEKPVLTVLDTLADLFPGNENDRAQARQFIAKLKRLAHKHDSAVVLLSHPSVAGMNSGTGASGSTAWSNSVRSRLYFERVRHGDFEIDKDLRKLTTKKANYGTTEGEVLVRWHQGSFVLDSGQSSGADLAVMEMFLEMLTKDAKAGIFYSPNANAAQTYAPRAFAKRAKFSKQLFEDAMRALLAAGKIKIEEDGPPTKRRKWLVPVDEAPTKAGGDW